MPDSRLLVDLFHLVRRNRFLWFFGLFAGTGSFNFSFNFPTGDDSGGSADSASSIDPAVVVAIAGGALLLLLVFLALSAISQGALADSVAALYRGEERRFGIAWTAGRSTFWRVVGLFILTGLIGLGLLLLIVLPLGGLVFGVFSATDEVAARIVVAVLAGLGALALLLVVFVPYSVIVQFAIRGVTLRRSRIRESLRAGWQLFRHNLGASLLTVGIQYGIAIAAGFVIGIVTVVVAIPLVILLLATDASAVAIGAAIFGAVLLLPVLLAASGALGAYNHGLWTLSYLRLAGPSAT